MSPRRWPPAFLAAFLLALPATLSRATDDDDPAGIQRELEAKIAKCLKKAEEAQRKAERKAARREAKAQHDVAKLEEQTLDDLEDRVEEYVKKVHKPAAKKLAPLPDGASPAQILEHRHGLAAGIRALRSPARQG